MRPQYALPLILLLGCEKEDPRITMMKESKKREAQRLERVEGTRLFFAVEKPPRKAGNFTIPFEAPPVTAHLRKDCPELAGWPLKECKVSGGRLIDPDGFYQDKPLCDRCVE